MGTAIKVVRPGAKARAVIPAKAVQEEESDTILLDAAAALDGSSMDEETLTRHAFIPHPDYGLNYVHRKVHGVEDFDLLTHCRANQLNLLLMGDTGAGKTMLPMAYAAAKCIPYYTVPCDVSIDPTALFGKMMPGDKVGEFVWVDGPVTELVRYGGILNISEINFMPAKIAASLYSLLDHRRSIQLLGKRGEHVRAHPDLLVVADMNPKYRGTMDLNHALNNRFPLKVQWGYDDTVEDRLVSSKALLSLVRKIRAQSDILTPIGTNMMMEFMPIAVAFGMKFAIKNFTNAFTESERESISQMLDAAETNIGSDVAIYAKKKKLPGAAEIEELELDEDEEIDPDEYEMEPVANASNKARRTP